VLQPAPEPQQVQDPAAQTESKSEPEITSETQTPNLIQSPSQATAPVETTLVQGRLSVAGQGGSPAPIEVLVEPSEPVRVKPESIAPEPVSIPSVGFEKADLPKAFANIGLFGSGLVALLALLKLMPRLRGPRLGRRIA
jgi:hypothetical protein